MIFEGDEDGTRHVAFSKCICITTVQHDDAVISVQYLFEIQGIECTHLLHFDPERSLRDPDTKLGQKCGQRAERIDQPSRVSTKSLILRTRSSLIR
jgi:hypothetical protein